MPGARSRNASRVQASHRTRALGAALVTGSAYVIVGIAAAHLERSAASIRSQEAWGSAPWATSFVVFASQILYERVRLHAGALGTAVRASATAALSALLLGVASPVRARFGVVYHGRVVVPSLVFWPLLVGAPAFVIALVVGVVIRRRVPTALSESNRHHAAGTTEQRDHEPPDRGRAPVVASAQHNDRSADSDTVRHGT